MNNILTTCGIFTEEMQNIEYENTISLSVCNKDDIEDLIPVHAGTVKIVLAFK